MALHDPSLVYVSMSNTEAHLLRNLLINSGVNAVVVEDQSFGGNSGGTTPGNNLLLKAQIWVEKSNVETARQILSDNEQRKSPRDRESSFGETSDGDSVDVVCEECSNRACFPSSLRGTVQDCPHCGGYLDVD